MMFIKEDEDLYPDLDYSPVAERTRRAMAAIERVRDQRRGLGLVYAPHVTAGPEQIVELVLAVVEAGASGVMFSESYAGGTVRMIREATSQMKNPPAIYGHNAGIGVKTRSIWREVIDLLARLDGIDFRQTAPLRPGSPFIRPYGAEWRASEDALTRPIKGINPTMITRAARSTRATSSSISKIWNQKGSRKTCFSSQARRSIPSREQTASLSPELASKRSSRRSKFIVPESSKERRLKNTWRRWPPWPSAKSSMPLPRRFASAIRGARDDHQG